jgi:hypothetical protein
MSPCRLDRGLSLCVGLSGAFRLPLAAVFSTCFVVAILEADPLVTIFGGLVFGGTVPGSSGPPRPSTRLLFEPP